MDILAVTPEGCSFPTSQHFLNQMLSEMIASRLNKSAGFDYLQFKRIVNALALTRQQRLPLKLRLETLESFMTDSDIDNWAVARPKNGVNEAPFGNDWSAEPGILTIVNLSSPSCTAEDACAMFNLCMSLFLKRTLTANLIIGLDEAQNASSSLCGDDK